MTKAQQFADKYGHDVVEILNHAEAGGLKLIQDWSVGTTTVVFDDGSAIVCSDGVEVVEDFHYESPWSYTFGSDLMEDPNWPG